MTRTTRPPLDHIVQRPPAPLSAVGNYGPRTTQSILVRYLLYTVVIAHALVEVGNGWQPVSQQHHSTTKPAAYIVEKPPFHPSNPRKTNPLRRTRGEAKGTPNNNAGSHPAVLTLAAAAETSTTTTSNCSSSSNTSGRRSSYTPLVFSIQAPNRATTRDALLITAQQERAFSPLAASPVTLRPCPAVLSRGGPPGPTEKTPTQFPRPVTSTDTDSSNYSPPPKQKQKKERKRLSRARLGGRRHPPLFPCPRNRHRAARGNVNVLAPCFTHRRRHFGKTLRKNEPAKHTTPDVLLVEPPSRVTLLPAPRDRPPRTASMAELRS